MSARSRPFKRIEKRLVGRTAPTTTAATSARMSQVRQRDTTPELLVRRAFRAFGLSYRTRNRDLPGSPDLANRAHRWAVFVHGCYWHRHKSCAKATIPRSNVEFWAAKFDYNVKRDRTARAALRRLGYSVLTVWQCEAESPSKLNGRLANFARSLVPRSDRNARAVSRAR